MSSGQRSGGRTSCEAWRFVQMACNVRGLRTLRLDVPAAPRAGAERLDRSCFTSFSRDDYWSHSGIAGRHFVADGCSVALGVQTNWMSEDAGWIRR